MILILYLMGVCMSSKRYILHNYFIAYILEIIIDQIKKNHFFISNNKNVTDF